MNTKKLKKESASSSKRQSLKKKPDYPLQGTALDISLREVMSFTEEKRLKYIKSLIGAFRKLIKKDEMALKRRVSFKAEMRDLRKLFYAAPDQYLFTEDKNRRRWVLGKGSPGSTHVYWSRHQIWKMKTKGGSLQEMIMSSSPRLIKSMNRVLDPKIRSAQALRNDRKSAIVNVLEYLQFDNGVGCSFPPFHAKFLGDKYLPKDQDGIVVDPCAGWGGRLLGTLLVNRQSGIKYIGIDPEERNRHAYEGLTRRANVWLKREIGAPRESQIYYKPFEDWIKSTSAKKLFGKVDLVLTSPPYFGAENYNPENPNQSANRYTEYLLWREQFYRQLFKGAYQLLKPGSHFVLNIADVAEAPNLERDASKMSREEGFEWAGFYKLAMSVLPMTRKAGTTRHVVYVKGSQFKYEPVFVFRKPKKPKSNVSK